MVFVCAVLLSVIYVNFKLNKHLIKAVYLQMSASHHEGWNSTGVEWVDPFITGCCQTISCRQHRSWWDGSILKELIWFQFGLNHLLYIGFLNYWIAHAHLGSLNGLIQFSIWAIQLIIKGMLYKIIPRELQAAEILMRWIFREPSHRDLSCLLMLIGWHQGMTNVLLWNDNIPGERYQAPSVGQLPHRTITP